MHLAIRHEEGAREQEIRFEVVGLSRPLEALHFLPKSPVFVLHSGVVGDSVENIHLFIVPSVCISPVIALRAFGGFTINALTVVAGPRHGAGNLLSPQRLSQPKLSRATGCWAESARAGPGATTRAG